MVPWLVNAPLHHQNVVCSTCHDAKGDAASAVAAGDDRGVDDVRVGDAAAGDVDAIEFEADPKVIETAFDTVHEGDTPVYEYIVEGMDVEIVA